MSSVSTPSSRTDFEKNEFLTKMRNKSIEAPPLRSIDAVEIKKNPNRAPDQSTNKKLGYELPVPGGKGVMTLNVKSLINQTDKGVLNISDKTRDIINLGIYERGKYKPKNEEVRKAVDDLEQSLSSLYVSRQGVSYGAEHSLPDSKELHKLFEKFDGPPEMPPLQSERSLVWLARANCRSDAEELRILKHRLGLALEVKDRDVAHDLKAQVERAEVKQKIRS